MDRHLTILTKASKRPLTSVTILYMASHRREFSVHTATAAVAVAIAVLATSACGGSTKTSTSGGGAPGAEGSGSSAGSISGTSDDWLSAVCTPGRFVDGAPMSGATGGGSCEASNGGGFVFITQWDSDFKMRNAMQKMGQCYASIVYDSGSIDTFSTRPATANALSPLTQFGFTSTC